MHEKLIKIGAKVVRHAKYVSFQKVEVAVPRDLFAPSWSALSGCVLWPGQYLHDDLTGPSE